MNETKDQQTKPNTSAVSNRVQHSVRRCVDCQYFKSLDETIIDGECWHPFFDHIPGDYPYISNKNESPPESCPLKD